MLRHLLATSKIRNESQSFSLLPEITNSSNKQTKEKKKKQLNSTHVLTPRLTPSYSGSPFSEVVCSTALQMRGVNPCVCTHRSSLASLTSLIPPGEQSSAGDGAHTVGKGEFNPVPEAHVHLPLAPIPPLRAPCSAVGSHWALSFLSPPSTSLQ